MSEEINTSFGPETMNKPRVTRRRWAPILRLAKSGDKTEIRFLDEFFGDRKFPQHQDKDNFIPTTCAKVYGMECMLCSNNVPITDGLFWNVLDFQDKTVKLLRLWTYQEPLIHQLYEYYKQNGSITNTNWIYERTQNAQGKTRFALSIRKRETPDEQKIIADLVKQSAKYDLKEALKPSLPKITTDDTKKPKNTGGAFDNLLD